MEIKSQTNTFEGGMDMDTDVSFVANNTYRYAENVRIVTDTNGTNGILLNILYIKEYLSINQLNDQTILYAIAALLPDENGDLLNSAIVLTQDNQETTHNHLYIVSNFNSLNITCKCILKILWKITKDDEISMIYNYETSSVYKLYINTYNNGLSIINLYDLRDEWGDKPVEDNPSKYNVTIKTTLPPLKFDKFTSGNLLSGTYQYFYKLYTDTGVITTVSSGSELIYNGRKITLNATESGGYYQGYTTTNGIQLSVSLNNTQFSHYLIFRVHWENNTDLPKIQLFSEGKLSKGSILLDIIDANNNVISTITLEEFNDIIPFLFNSKTMYLFGNRLFFSNITSDSWDIPDTYDCRAYRANSEGNVQLLTATGENYFNSSVSLRRILNGAEIVDKEADAVNPMNEKTLYPEKNSDDEYAYDSTGRYGGEGINIRYNIVYSETQEGSYVGTRFEDGKAYCSVWVGPYATDDNMYDNNAKIFYLGESGLSQLDVDFEEKQIVSYYNPFVSTKLASYQRDEVYRFGVIFYNDLSIASPVHWIGDIRFPSADTVGCEAFSQDANKKIDLIAKPLGLVFYFKNFPDGAVAAEIVRCDRTSADRSIRALGLLSTAVHFTNRNITGSYDADISLGENDIRAPFIPSIYVTALTDGDHSVGYEWSSGASNRFDLAYDVKLLASPEICINPDADNIQQGDVIVPLYIAKSIMGKAYSTEQLLPEHYRTTYGVGYEVKGSGGTGLRPMITLYDRIYIRHTEQDTFCTTLLKYYNLTSASTYFKNHKDVQSKTDNEDIYTAIINLYKTARRDLPFQGFTDINDTYKLLKGTYVDVINGMSYTNVAVANNSMGVAGINGLLGIETDYDDLLHDAYGGDNDGAVTSIICNIKRKLNPYGGNTYYNRAANNYISCGAYVTKGSQNCVVFGGDTFLTSFCYQHVGMITSNDYTATSPEFSNSVFMLIPVESTINTYMRSDENPSLHFQSGDFNPAFYHTQVGTLNTVSQTTAMYQYNSAYSVSSSGITYAAASTNSNISNTENNRYLIVCTEAKSAGEVLDSWAVSKFANTLDMDSKYGQVNRLIDFRDRLYVLLQNALSVLSINERALISDNSGASLVLGSGGVLDRYDVIVQNYGTNVVNDRSVVSTFLSIYWYDNNKNVICSYGNDGFHILSKEKKVQTFLNNIAQLDLIDATFIVNDKQNEVWMKFKGKLLAYNEHSNLFTSFYTHHPDWGLRFYDRLVTILNKRFYYTNTFGEEDVVKTLNSKLTFVVNQDQQYTKVFDNLWFAGNIEDPNSNKLKVLNNINFSTKNLNSLSIDYNDVECREDTYRFAIPRQDRGDIGTGDEGNQDVINRSYQPRMRGKYLICNYEFNCNEDRKFEIPFIKTTYRYSSL